MEPVFREEVLSTVVDEAVEVGDEYERQKYEEVTGWMKVYKNKLDSFLSSLAVKQELLL